MITRSSNLGIAPVVASALTDLAAKAIASLKLIAHGKTPHKTADQVSSVASNIATAIDSLVKDNITSQQYAQEQSQIPSEVANWIRNSSWWKVGNDQLPRIPDEIQRDAAGSLQGTLTRLYIWALANTPSDNNRDAWSATDQCLNATLYQDLVNIGANNLVQAIQAYVQTVHSGTTPASLPQNATLQDLIDIFTGKKTTAQVQQQRGGTSTASIFSAQNLIVGGVLAFILIGMLVSTRKGSPYSR